MTSARNTKISDESGMQKFSLPPSDVVCCSEILRYLNHISPHHKPRMNKLSPLCIRYYSLDEVLYIYCKNKHLCWILQN